MSLFHRPNDDFLRPDLFAVDLFPVEAAFHLQKQPEMLPTDHKLMCTNISNWSLTSCIAEAAVSVRIRKIRIEITDNCSVEHLVQFGPLRLAQQWPTKRVDYFYSKERRAKG